MIKVARGAEKKDQETVREMNHSREKEAERGIRKRFAVRISASRNILRHLGAGKVVRTNADISI